MVLACRVAENHMIDLTGSNQKLRKRALRIVMDLSGADERKAEERLRHSSCRARRTAT